MQLSDSEQITSSDEEQQHHGADYGRGDERLPASSQGEVREEVEQTEPCAASDDRCEEELQMRSEDLTQVDDAEALDRKSVV